MSELETMLLQSLETMTSEAQVREERLIMLLTDLQMECSSLTKQVRDLTAAQQDYRSLENTCKELRQQLEKSARDYRQQQQEIDELQKNLKSLRQEVTQQELHSKQSSDTMQKLLDSIKNSIS